MDDRRARHRTPAACGGPVQEKRIRAGKCRNGACGAGLRRRLTAAPRNATRSHGTHDDRCPAQPGSPLGLRERAAAGYSCSSDFTLAESARLMPVSASPSPRPRAPKPASSSASRRPRGRRSTSRSSRRASTRHAPVPAPRHGGPPAPIEATDPLRQSRRHCTAPAGSDDARNAPAINGLTQAGARDDPK